MKHYQLIILTAFIIGAQACKSKPKKTEAEVKPVQTYRSSVTKVNDLVHTKLELMPNFEKKEMQGTATLSIHPHFYPVDSLILDAKYMLIVSVDLLSTTRKSDYNLVTSLALSYGYD